VPAPQLKSATQADPETSQNDEQSASVSHAFHWTGLHALVGPLSVLWATPPIAGRASLMLVAMRS
jgi:hypothetical protein